MAAAATTAAMAVYDEFVAVPSYTAGNITVAHGWVHRRVLFDALTSCAPSSITLAASASQTHAATGKERAFTRVFAQASATAASAVTGAPVFVSAAPPTPVDPALVASVDTTDGRTIHLRKESTPEVLLLG